MAPLIPLLGPTILRLAAPLAVLAFVPAQAPARSSMEGVYTLAQAAQGRNVFASACQSCHTATFHAGPPFRNKWFGRTVGELFGYLRREMPKSDPGSLSDEEYMLSIAYILRINGMPPGAQPLAADSAVLHRIRIDSLSAPTSSGPRR